MAVAPTLVAALLAAAAAASRPTAPVALHVSTDAEDAPPPTTLQPERPLTPPSLAARRARFLSNERREPTPVEIQAAIRESLSDLEKARSLLSSV